MLTPEDIQRITEAQIEAQKNFFYSKEELDTKFSTLYTKNELDTKFSTLPTNEVLDKKFGLFPTSQELEQTFYSKAEMDEKFSSLQTSMDSIIKDKATRDTEAATTTYKIEKIETWIDQAAPKLDIKFEH